MISLNLAKKETFFIFNLVFAEETVNYLINVCILGCVRVPVSFVYKLKPGLVNFVPRQWEGTLLANKSNLTIQKKRNLT
jgi:hypothetical protein